MDATDKKANGKEVTALLRQKAGYAFWPGKPVPGRGKSGPEHGGTGVDPRAVSWPVRTIEPNELREFVGVPYVAFGRPEVTDDDFSDDAIIAETDRCHVALDGDAFVGTAGEYSFDLTIPGGATLPMAGVTAVGVLPTHRRRGVLTALMAYELDSIAARGEPIAGLTASEGGIYRRFGYGIASRYQMLEVDDGAQRVPPPVRSRAGRCGSSTARTRRRAWVRSGTRIARRPSAVSPGSPRGGSCGARSRAVARGCEQALPGRARGRARRRRRLCRVPVQGGLGRRWPDGDGEHRRARVDVARGRGGAVAALPRHRPRDQAHDVVRRAWTTRSRLASPTGVA